VWTDAQGVKQSKAEFHSVVAWRKLAEICAQYLKKGRRVYIEGRLQTRDWEDQNGVKRYKTEIVADNMIMLDRGGVGSSNAGEGAFAAGGMGSQAGVASGAPETSGFSRQPAAPATSPDAIGSGTSSAPQVEEEEIRVEDIPF
jgi:single-strand DNA-binding protein